MSVRTDVFYDLHPTVRTFQLFEQLGKFMVKQNMFLRFNFDLWWKKKNQWIYRQQLTQINEDTCMYSSWSQIIESKL